MIYSEPSCISGKKCIRYWGEHEELRIMLKEGDIVTLLWQNDDKSESIKITGTVTRRGGYVVDVIVASEKHAYAIDARVDAARRIYTITNIKRLVENMLPDSPVENMLPDSPGPWTDKDEDTWIVDDDLNAIRVSYDGEWLTGERIALPSEYADYAPFKKINIIKENVTNEQA